MIAVLWVGFVLFVLIMLALDLFVVNRDPHVIHTREAMIWTGVTVMLALLFGGLVYFIYGHNYMGVGTRYALEYAAAAGGSPLMDPATTPGADHQVGARAAIQFITGWMIEYSLSLDNIFVIALIFAHFRVPMQFQHRVLFWGILGALILRGVMIGAGATLVARFEWILYIFGIILIVTAVKLLFQKEDGFDPEKGLVMRMARRVLPLSAKLDGQKFFVLENGRRLATPLFLVLIVVETTDVVFAVDSIPAIFGITRDPFLIFTSNVFAILGLRSLYFALAALMNRFGHLKYSLAFVLAFVGVKMLLEMPAQKIDWSLMGYRLAFEVPLPGIHIPPVVSLGVIAFALAAGIVTSLYVSRNAPTSHRPDEQAEGAVRPDSGEA